MKRSVELETLTCRLYDAVSNGDISFFERHLSQSESCIVIGTGPSEWWNDYSSALDAIRGQMDAVGQALKLIAGDLSAYRQDDVGWVADRPTLKLGSTEVICRHTSVFMRGGGEWRIVQHHFSIGVTNEDVFGKDAAHFSNH